MTILLPNIRIFFSSFSADSSTDKLGNRSIHAYDLTQLNVFALKGFIFHDIHKKTGKEFEEFGLKIPKICAAFSTPVLTGLGMRA